MTNPDPIDVLVYGATGYVGRRVCRLLIERCTQITIGVCARNPEKLEFLVDNLTRDHSEKLGEKGGETGDIKLEVVLADSAQPQSVDDAVARAKVVIGCAGPFAKYGTPVVDACVKHGVHYVDITGETPWVRGLIERHHDEAKAKGTFIVPFAGYDSVPSDLCTWLAVDALQEAGERTRKISNAMLAAGAGVNGGTAQTGLMMYGSPDLKRLFDDPFTLCPADDVDDATRARSRDSLRPQRDLGGTWRPPFFMGSINSRVVRRSASLFAAAGKPYSSAGAFDFEYAELMDMGGSFALPKALIASGMLKTTETLLGFGPTRAILARLVPESGEGPTDAQIEKGFTRARVMGLGDDGGRVTVTLQSQGDAGNAVTASLVVECARALLEDGEALGVGEPERGGLLTPAFALGQVLPERLRQAGMTLVTELE